MTGLTATTWRTRATVAALAVAALLVAVLPAWGVIYTDIVGLPSQRAIERLSAKGIMRVTGDKFNPNGPMTRAELAIFLTRALGLSAQGVPAPDVKDWTEVAREAQPSVAVMSSMGTVSPQKVELRKDQLLYQLTADKAVYGPTDWIELTFTITNTGKTDVKFEYTNTQLHDFIIRDSQGNEVARWSLGRAFLPINQPVTLAAGQKFQPEPTRWKQLDQNDEPVAPGRYEIIAVHTTKANPTTLALVFNRGVMQVFPDRTFRPKLEVSRAEMAATIAKVLGLPEAPAALQNVADASEIPAADRGAVAAAVEKRIILVGADRMLRPTRPATRADVALALDTLMDMLKKYDFSKGTLKDIRVGTPTLMQIEDETKSMRTFRVARAYAVYRNNAAADLKDLKVGDALLFLKVGDVGDVAYIEATGR